MGRREHTSAARKPSQNSHCGDLLVLLAHGVEQPGRRARRNPRGRGGRAAEVASGGEMGSGMVVMASSDAALYDAAGFGRATISMPTIFRFRRATPPSPCAWSGWWPASRSCWCAAPVAGLDRRWQSLRYLQAPACTTCGRPATPSCATTRSSATCASCWNSSGQKCGSTSSRATPKPHPSRAPSARWSTSAPRASPTTGPSARSSNVAIAGYEWINHSMQPTELVDHDFRIVIGGAPNPAAPRRDLHAALQRQRVQHLGDELRRAVGQRDPGA